MPDTADQEPPRRPWPTALVALVPATLVAAIPLGLGVAGRYSTPQNCESGMCGVSALFFYVAPVVWLVSWPLFGLIVLGIRKLFGVSPQASGAGPPSGGDAG